MIKYFVLLILCVVTICFMIRYASNRVNEKDKGIWVFCEGRHGYVCRGQLNSIEHAKEYIKDYNCYILVDGKRLK
jgi:hypothetical protein